MDIVTFLHARIDEDERIAKEACHESANGEHWQWENSDTDEVVDLTTSDEYLENAGQVSLRSKEEYPTKTVGPLPHFAVPSSEEQQVGPARHIARWDPARVLAEVRAKRTLLDYWTSCALRGVDAGQHYGRRAMAAVYESHEDYQPAWGPTMPRMGDKPVDSLWKL